MLGELLTQADIRKAEFAELAKVDRRTVHNWINGMSPKSHHIKEALDEITFKIKRAIANEELPVRHLTGKERLRALQIILK